MAETIHDLLAPHAAAWPAILAPDRATLTYGELRTLVDATLASLAGQGIGRNDRVAIVLPNGPEMATAFIAIACGATTAPLNPAYREDELDFYLTDLQAKALVVPAGADGPAVAVARRHGTAILRLHSSADRSAGWFELQPEAGKAPAAERSPEL